MRNYVFLPSDFEFFKSRVKQERIHLFNHLIEQCNRYKSIDLPNEHPKKSTTYMGIAIGNLSLCYRLTHQSHILEEAKRWIKAVLRYPTWGFAHLVNVDLSAAWILFGLSLGYDWLKDDLDSFLAEQIKEKLLHHADIMYQYKMKTHGKGWSTNYWQNHNWINLTGLATAGYVLRSSCDETTLWIETAKTNFKKVYSYLADDGSNYEGTVYWHYGTLWLFIYAHLLKNEENIDYFKTSKYLRNTFYYRLYQSVPNLEETANFGDCHDTRSSHSAAIYYKIAAEFQNGHAQSFGHFVDSIRYKEHYESKIKPGILSEIMFELLWFDPNIDPLPISSLPKNYYFEDLGLISYRSSWDTDALFLSFKCGHPGGKKQWRESWIEYNENNVNTFGLSHQHPDNASFILHAHGSYLVSDDGYNRNMKAKDHNLVTIGEKGYPIENINDVLTASAFHLKDTLLNFNPATDFIAEITDYFDHDLVTVFSGQTAQMYDRSLSILHNERIMITTHQNHFYIIDTIRSQKENTFTWRLHTPTKAIRVTTAQHRFENGLAAMDVHTILPKQSNISFSENYVKAVMTTQEPDKFYENTLQVMAVENKEPSSNMSFLNVLTVSPANLQTHTVKPLNPGVLVETENKQELLLLHPNDHKDIETDSAWILLCSEHQHINAIVMHGGSYLKYKNVLYYYEGSKRTTVVEV